MKNLFLMSCGILMGLMAFAQPQAEWMRYPAISPDGQTIAFSYKGDIYTVPAAGGEARPLTLHEAYDFMPVWSHDGKSIAFASDRYGNFDLYLIPAAGGAARRLTFHSSHDFPSDFSHDDRYVIFSSSRLDAASNQMFPSGAMPELYRVPVDGGAEIQWFTIPMEHARVSADGSKIFYHDRKGYEDPFRKHHTSSEARDIWMHNLGDGTFTRLSSYIGEDRSPVPAPDGDRMYYLSEASGSFNVFSMRLSDPGKTEQITRFSKHPLRSLSISKAGQLCFGYDGQLYTLRPGEEPRRLELRISTDERYNSHKVEKVNSGATEFHLSPNGREVAFVYRGEVFVSSTAEGGATRRITNTPGQERSVSFSPDGRSLLYAAERNDSWDVYQTRIVREEEPYFFAATLLEEEALVATDAEEFQPSWSPDGKEIAYLEERTALRVFNLKDKKSRMIIPGNKSYSYSDGDQYYEWSPDGKWLLAEFLQDNQWISQIGLISAEGGEILNLSRSGYNNFSPRWMMDGRTIIWFSDRDGMKNDASWGGELDVYGMFLSQEAFDRFKLSKEDFELLKEKEKKEKEDKGEKDEQDKKDKTKKKIEPIVIETEDIHERKARLSVHSSRLADAVLSKDGEKLYYLARFEKGLDLWQTAVRTKETKLLLKLDAGSAGGLQWDEDGKFLYLMAEGKIYKVNVEDGKKEQINFNGEMLLNEMAERAYLFEHVWRQAKKKFYLPDLHGVDWDFYKTAYQRFLPHINNNYDFAELLSEMLGELNASHTGGRYRPTSETGDITASLGLFYDHSYDGNGLLVAEVMQKGPFDNSQSRLKAGMVIEKIDGEEIRTAESHFPLLNRKAGKPTLISCYDPKNKKRWDEMIKPITPGEENELRYRRWVNNCRRIVEEASGGKIGYVHVRGMDDPSFRTVYEEALGRNAGKQALVVDTRFNGGGWLHDDLATFLDGKVYLTMMPRGQNLGNEPQFKWAKPSVVVMCESNYSDAHMFPYTYKALGIGKLVGMPVPGTATAVWWETLQNKVVFGIPQVGMLTPEGKYLENTQLEPDIKVPNDPALVSKGRDQQLEAAVAELLRQLESGPR